MKIYVINLKRRVDRLEKFIKNCPLSISNIEVIYGYDGSNSNNENDEEKEIFNTLKMSKGANGVFISHLRIYKDIIENNYEHALIFEDDALFCDNFIEKFNTVCKEFLELKNNDVLYIGGRFDPNFRMQENNYTKISDNIVTHKINNNIWIPREHDRTCHAYIISNKCAKLLLDKFFFENKNICPIDHWMINIFRENNINIYNSEPLLCHSPLIGDSDIRCFNNKKKFSSFYIRI